MLHTLNKMEPNQLFLWWLRELVAISQDIEILVHHGHPILLPSTSVPAVVKKAKFDLWQTTNSLHAPISPFSDIWPVPMISLGEEIKTLEICGLSCKISKPSVVSRIMAHKVSTFQVLDTVYMLPHMAKWTLQIQLRLWILKQFLLIIWQTVPEVFDKQSLALMCREPHLKNGERILGAKGGPKLAASKVSETSVPPNTWY